MPEQTPSPSHDPSSFLPRPRRPDPAETPELREDTFETIIDIDDDEAGPGGVRIEVPGGRVVGLLQDPASPPGVARLADLTVTDERKGKGTYLVGVFAREAIARGAHELYSDIINPQAMRNRVRIFGEHNLTFVRKYPDGTEEILNITAEEAVARLEEAERQADEWDEAGEPWPPDFSPSIGTRVNLMSPSVRLRIGLPPIAEGLDPAAGTEAVSGTPAGAEGKSVGDVRSELGNNVEIVRQIGDLVLGSSTTLRAALSRLQEAMAAAETGGAAQRLSEALERAGISIEQLNTAIEELRRYDRDIGSL